MPVTQVLGDWYAKAEDKFFGALDWLDAKGIPVYAYSNALESRGIPSFPVTIALGFILLFGIFWLLLAPASSETTILLGFTDQMDATLSQVDVKVLDESGKELFKGTKNNGDSILLSAVPGKELSVIASKTGFDPASTKIRVRSNNEHASLVLSKQFKPVLSRIRFVDSETGSPITNADVSMSWGNIVRTGKTDSNGFFSADGLPENEDVLLSVNAENYEATQTTVRLLDGQSRSIPLTPKNTATFGSAKLIIKAFEKESGLPLDGAKVIIAKSNSDDVFFEGETSDGQYVADLPKGTVFVVRVSKPGYIRFASKDQTLRDDPTQVTVELQKGGNKIRAIVSNKETGLPLSGTLVSLFKTDSTKLDEQSAPFSGTVEFSGLNPDENYFISAFLAGYLPFVSVFSPMTETDVEIELEPETTANTAKLNVYVTASDGLAGNNASLTFFEIINGVRIPSGIPSATTEYDGFASVKVPLGRNYWTLASRGLEAGDANKIIANGENNVAIKMKLVDSAKRLRVLGIDGNPVVLGLITIETQAKDVLFDGNLTEDGSILFDAKTAEFINVTVTIPDGNVFSTQESVKGKKEIVIRLKPNNGDSLSPPVTFLGLEDSEGNAVTAITPGKEYWARLQVDWATGEYRGGLHVRVGNDNEPFADSDDVGITGFDAGKFSSFNYSRSFSPIPAPGNEALDMVNRGEAGQYNKWVEIYVDNPKGTQVFRVKIQAKETIDKQNVFLRYRSWALVGTSYHRSPEDAELGTDQFSNSKTALYAQTNAEQIPVFSSQPGCADKVCVTFEVVVADGETIPKSEFSYAGRGRVYAIEATIKSQETIGGLLKATTPKQKPKLFFTGTEVESFTQFIDNNYTLTAIEINDLSILENVERKARIYFKPVQDGSATVHVEFLAEGTTIKDDFFFNVGEERNMIVKVEPSIVEIGDPFVVSVMDEAEKPIENATVHIRDYLNAIVSTMVASSRSGFGRNGEYQFSGSIGAGEFSAEVTAPGFAPKSAVFSISASDALVIPEEIIIKIPQGQTAGEASVSIENVSQGVIRDIEVQVLQNEKWPIELSVTAGTVFSLRQGQKGKLDVTAAYMGDYNKIVQGEAELIVKGFVTGKYPAVTKTRLVVSYNQPLDDNCLEFIPGSLEVFLAANAPYPGVDNMLSPSKYYSDYTRYNASYAPYYSSQNDQQYYNAQTDQSQYRSQYDTQNQSSNYDAYYNNYYDRSTPTYSNQYGGTYSRPSNYYAPYSNVYENYDNQQQEIEIQVKNNCGVALNLSGEAVTKQGATKDQFLQITVPPLILQPNESTTTTISIRNLRDRIISRQEIRDFDLVYAYNPVLKTIPLKVILWDSRYALAMTNNIVLFLSQGKKGEPVISSQPVFVRNVGLQNIENFNLHLSGDTYQNGVDIRIVPSGDVPVLGKNQVIFPPKMLVAELRGGTDKGRLVRGEIVATGMINGKEMELRRANVWVHVSAYECLRISPAESLDFISSESSIGTIDRKIKVRNTCEEPVRVVSIEPNRLGANEVTVVWLSSDLLQPDAEAEFYVRVVKRQDYKSQNLNFAVVGLTTVTRKFISSNRLHALVELGRTAVSTGAATEPYTINYCNDDGSISAETTQIQFPKMATSANCDKAYCDATQATEYILKKLDQKLNQVKSAIGTGNAEVINFADNCIVSATNPTCSFGQLDPKIPETFDLFLQNDQITTDLLQKMIQDKGSADLKAYQANYCPGSTCDAKVVAASGYPNLLLVSSNLRGCGRLRVSVDGAAFVNQNQIRTDGFTLALNVANYEMTPECANRIENVHNFLPIDKDLTMAGPYGTLLGTAEADERFLPLAESFAKEFFGQSDGRVSANSQGNRVRMETGDVAGGIVRIGLNQSGGSQEPKLITAVVNRSIEGVDLTKDSQNEVASEAAKAFAALKSRQIPLGKGCISKNHDYFVLGSAAKLGDLTLSGPEKMDVLPGTETCIDVNITSELRETVSLEHNASEVLGQSNGFSQIVLKKKTDKSVLSDKQEIQLEENPVTKKFSNTVLLCATGSTYFQFAQSAPKIKISAQSTIDSVRKSKEKEIGYQACGIHPVDLANKLQSLESGKEYYATVGWKGEPNTATLRSVIEQAGAKGLLTDKATLTDNQGLIANQPTTKEAVKKHTLAAIWGPASYAWDRESPNTMGRTVSYITACAATSALCNGFRTLGWGAIAGPIIDCGIPALWATAPLTSMADARKNLENMFGSTIGSVVSRVAKVAEAIWPGEISPLGNAEQQQAQEDLIDGATGAVGSHVLLGSTVKLAYGNYAPLGISSAARQISKDIIAQVEAEKLVKVNTIGSGGVDLVSAQDHAEFRNMIQKELQPALEESLTEKGKKTKIPIGKKSLVGLADTKLIEEATGEAISKASAKLEKPLSSWMISHANALQKPVKTLSQKELIQAISDEFGTDLPDQGNIATAASVKDEWRERMLGFLDREYGIKPDAEVSPGRTVRDVVDSKIIPREEFIAVGSRGTRTVSTWKLPDPKTTFKDSLGEIVQNPELVKKMDTALTKRAGEVAKELLNGKTGKVGRFTRFTKFLGSMAKGLFCGYISNAAGLAAYRQTLADPIKPIGPTVEVSGTQRGEASKQPVETQVGILDNDVILERGATYKITVTQPKDEKEKRKIQFAKVDSFADIPKSSWLNTDCSGQWGMKDLSGVIDTDALKKVELSDAAREKAQDEIKKKEARSPQNPPSNPASPASVQPPLQP